MGWLCLYFVCFVVVMVVFCMGVGWVMFAFWVVVLCGCYVCILAMFVELLLHVACVLVWLCLYLLCALAVLCLYFVLV